MLLVGASVACETYLVVFAVRCSLVVAVVSVDVLYPDIVADDDSDDSPVLKKSTAAVGYGEYIYR